MEVRAGSQTLDGCDLRRLVHHGEGQAGIYASPIHENGARSAGALITAALSPNELNFRFVHAVLFEGGVARPACCHMPCRAVNAPVAGSSNRRKMNPRNSAAELTDNCAYFIYTDSRIGTL